MPRTQRPDSLDCPADVNTVKKYLQYHVSPTTKAEECPNVTPADRRIEKEFMQHMFDVYKKGVPHKPVEMYQKTWPEKILNNIREFDTNSLKSTKLLNRNTEDKAKVI